MPAPLIVIPQSPSMKVSEGEMVAAFNRGVLDSDTGNSPNSCRFPSGYEMGAWKIGFWADRNPDHWVGSGTARTSREPWDEYKALIKGQPFPTTVSIDHGELEALREVARKALTLSTKMVETERGEEFDAIDEEWMHLTTAIEDLKTYGYFRE